jgi:hypothetical protein
MHGSLISFNNLATIEQRLVSKIIGGLAPTTLQQMNACLRAALAIP